MYGVDLLSFIFNYSDPLGLHYLLRLEELDPAILPDGLSLTLATFELVIASSRVHSAPDPKIRFVAAGVTPRAMQAMSDNLESKAPIIRSVTDTGRTPTSSEKLKSVSAPGTEKIRPARRRNSRAAPKLNPRASKSLGARSTTSISISRVADRTAGRVKEQRVRRVVRTSQDVTARPSRNVVGTSRLVTARPVNTIPIDPGRAKFFLEQLQNPRKAESVQRVPIMPRPVRARPVNIAPVDPERVRQERTGT